MCAMVVTGVILVPNVMLLYGFAVFSGTTAAALVKPVC